jgi:hypothetical protein
VSIVAISAAALLMLGRSGVSASIMPWEVMPTPNANSSDVDLPEVSCAGASDCVAVSTDGAALYWDASTWAVLPYLVLDLRTTGCTASRAPRVRSA